jgi:hypothetical protein
MESMGGSELMVPAHASVIMLGFPAWSTHVTKTTGTGFNMVEGFQTCLDILIHSLLFSFYRGLGILADRRRSPIAFFKLA